MPLFSQSSSKSFRFFSIGSGSSGNCYFLGNRDYGILIDAGIGIRKVLKTLTEYGTSINKIRALLVTHDHADHIKSVGVFAQKHGIPIYATTGTHRAMLNNKYMHIDIPNFSKKIVDLYAPFHIEDFKITAFEVPHDSFQNVGYRIEFGNHIFGLATDVGEITLQMTNHLKDANHIVMEANFDDNMLWQGRYPQHLKERITNGTGHLSNKKSAVFLSSIYGSHLKNVWLCHLSQDNNNPEVAFNEVAYALKQAGADLEKSLKLEALKRFKASGLRELI